MAAPGKGADNAEAAAAAALRALESPVLETDRPNVAPGEVREPPPSIRQHDAITAGWSQRRRNALGLGDVALECELTPENPAKRVLIGVRRPEQYTVEADRLEVVQSDWASAQAVTNAAGAPMTLFQDLVAVTISREEYEQARAARDARARQIHEDRTKKRRVQTNEGPIEEFPQRDIERLRAMVPAMTEAIIALGGGVRYPPSMSVEEIEHHIGADAVMEDERKHARGGRSERPNEAAEYRKRITEIRQRRAQGAGRPGNRTYSTPGRPTR